MRGQQTPPARSRRRRHPSPTPPRAMVSRLAGRTGFPQPLQPAAERFAFQFATWISVSGAHAYAVDLRVRSFLSQPGQELLRLHFCHAGQDHVVACDLSNLLALSVGMDPPTAPDPLNLANLLPRDGLMCDAVACCGLLGLAS